MVTDNLLICEGKNVNGLFNIAMLSISEFDSVNDIKAKIADLMKMYGNHVVANKMEARNYLKYAEIGKPLNDRDDVVVMLYSPKLGRYFKLYITAYYYDSGSDDYCYSIYMAEESY